MDHLEAYTAKIIFVCPRLVLVAQRGYRIALNLGPS